MPRIQGVDVPNGKPTYIALTYLYGIGRTTSFEICFHLGIDPQKKSHTLTEEEISRINNHLDKEHLIGGRLQQRIREDIDRLKQIGCYRGIRHRRGLPVRGQNTQTNARTRKGIKKTVAGKKGVKDMRH